MSLINMPASSGKPAQDPEPVSSPTDAVTAVAFTAVVFVFVGWLMTQGFTPVTALLITAASVTVANLRSFPRGMRKVLRWLGKYA
ncbi:hypothetical protein [Amycolatopsis japonica]